MQGESHSQEELAHFINKHYDPLSVADSIARHEYFMSEPLIAVPDENRFRVIEGNRRLTALRGLADPELRAAFAQENKGWNRLPNADLPEKLPVLIVKNEESVAPLLGFRHISGIEPWDPHAQARYIARLVSEESRSLDYVADLVGRSTTEVKAMYRDYDILEQADEFGLDTSRARAAFGVFTNAMGRRAIQNYVGAKPPRYTDPSFYPLPDDRKPQLERLLRWIFGGQRGEGKVISDSRQLGDLAKVLSHSASTAILERTGVLSDALDAMADVREQFLTATTRVNRELAKILQLDHSQVAEESWQAFSSGVASQLEAINELRTGLPQ